MKRNIEKRLCWLDIDDREPAQAIEEIQQEAANHKDKGYDRLVIRLEGGRYENDAPELNLYGIRRETDEEEAARESAQREKDLAELNRLKAKLEQQSPAAESRL